MGLDNLEIIYIIGIAVFGVTFFAFIAMWIWYMIARAKYSLAVTFVVPSVVICMAYGALLTHYSPRERTDGEEIIWMRAVAFVVGYSMLSYATAVYAWLNVLPGLISVVLAITASVCFSICELSYKVASTGDDARWYWWVMTLVAILVQHVLLFFAWNRRPAGWPLLSVIGQAMLALGTLVFLLGEKAFLGFFGTRTIQEIVILAIWFWGFIVYPILLSITYKRAPEGREALHYSVDPNDPVNGCQNQRLVPLADVAHRSLTSRGKGPDCPPRTAICPPDPCKQD